MSKARSVMVTARKKRRRNASGAGRRQQIVDNYAKEIDGYKRNSGTFTGQVKTPVFPLKITDGRWGVTSPSVGSMKPKKEHVFQLDFIIIRQAVGQSSKPVLF
jgi:hypothetical protein